MLFVDNLAQPQSGSFDRQKSLIFSSLLRGYLLAFSFFLFLHLPQAIANEDSPSVSLFKDDRELIYKNIIKSVSDDGSLVTLDDGMSFAIDWWYRSISKEWSTDKQIYICYDSQFNRCKLEDPLSGDVAWADLKSFPNHYIESREIDPSNQDAYSKITLNNGCCFSSIEMLGFCCWIAGHPVGILANSDGLYQIWNFRLDQIGISRLAVNPSSTTQLSRDPIEIKDIFSLEDRLNRRILQQEEATRALTNSLMIYKAGLKQKKRPLGVFLFIGPTGVGKTELVKALAVELYNDPLAVLRFDMSHFTEPHAIGRLIGSPPGYAEHNKGGQLTNPLQENPQKIVLLDEFEKAHPQIIKTFLPIFDEGFILDVKNSRIPCHDTIFIMTSNLCSQEISQLYHAGYDSEAILKAIEPMLMTALSPEVYNRVEPILFRPLGKETMSSLVDLMLSDIKQTVAVEKKIQLHFDDSLKNFLIENGYSPLLGARPLKKLIDREVLVILAKDIISNNNEENSNILLLYDKDSDSVKCIHTVMTSVDQG